MFLALCLSNRSTWLKSEAISQVIGIVENHQLFFDNTFVQDIILNLLVAISCMAGSEALA